MKIKYMCLVAAMAVLQACSVAPHKAFEAEKDPQNRKYYKGFSGLNQYLKDQDYLANREQVAKCERYIFEALEKSESDNAKHLGPLKSSCRGLWQHMLENTEEQVGAL